MTDRMGDDTTGFSLEFGPLPPCVHVRAWGFWSAEIASSFGSVVRDACRGRPRGTTLELDMKDLKPMREEGQQSVTKLLDALPTLGITATVIKTSSELTKLQMMRLVGERAKTAHVQFA